MDKLYNDLDKPETHTIQLNNNFDTVIIKDDNGNISLLIKKLDNNNIHLETKTEVYDGPIDLLLKI